MSIDVDNVMWRPFDHRIIRLLLDVDQSTTTTVAVVAIVTKSDADYFH
jgi:hypothetical protein